ncbi:MAG: hypothetical protein CMJ30_07040 [Phycisphaerae bacterium]|jgi:hypothetical protein|nr:hypothetical protein [Phycisphaerae bacterium]
MALNPSRRPLAFALTACASMLVLIGCEDEASVRRAEAQDKIENGARELAALSWRGDADAYRSLANQLGSLRATNGQNKAARAIAMEARLAAADTEYGALEAMAFEVEGLRTQIRDQARLASAFREVAASPTKRMLRDESEAASNERDDKAEAYESARRNVESLQEPVDATEGKITERLDQISGMRVQSAQLRGEARRMEARAALARVEEARKIDAEADILEMEANRMIAERDFLLQSKVRIGDSRKNGAEQQAANAESLARGISDFQSERQEDLENAAQEATSIERDIRELLSQMSEVRQAIGEKLKSAQQDLEAARDLANAAGATGTDQIRLSATQGRLDALAGAMLERDLALDLELAPLGFDPVGDVDAANQARNSSREAFKAARDAIAMQDNNAAAIYNDAVVALGGQSTVQRTAMRGQGADLIPTGGFGSAEALIAAANQAAKSEDLAAILAMTLVDEEAKPFMEAMVNLAPAMKRLEQVVSENIPDADLEAMMGGMGGGMGGGMDGLDMSMEGMLELMQSDDTKGLAINDTTGEQIKLANTENGWFLDERTPSAEEDPEAAMAAEMGRAMMGMMTGILSAVGPSLEELADQIEAGEITSEAELQAAAQQMMMQMMGGMGAPGGFPG